MFWNFDQISGNTLFGWLSLENRARQPVVVVVIDGKERLRLAANIERVDLKAVGWHETGLCGFSITPDTIPGLSLDLPIEIFEEETNTLIFRRGGAETMPAHLFHLETQTFPVYSLDAALAPHMQMKYDSAELIGEETLTCVVQIEFCDSLIVSGGILYRRYSGFLRRNNFHCSVLLSHPVREVAGRLVQAQMLAAHAARGGAEAASGWRRMGQAPLIEAFAGVDLRRSGAIASAFRKLSDEHFFALADPLTRKLVTMSPGDAVEDQHVAAALDTLAEFDLVGFETDLPRFVEPFEAMLGNARLPREALAGPPDFDEVVEAVAGCRPVAELIRLDMAVYEAARMAAVKASAAGSGGALAKV